MHSFCRYRMFSIIATRPSADLREEICIALRHNFSICAEIHRGNGTGATLQIAAQHIEHYAAALERMIYDHNSTIEDYNGELKTTYEALLLAEEDEDVWNHTLATHFSNTALDQSITGAPGIESELLLSLDLVTQARAMLPQSAKVIDAAMHSRALTGPSLKCYCLAIKEGEEENMAQKIGFWRHQTYREVRNTQSILGGVHQP
jgi:hypothetical protein